MSSVKGVLMFLNRPDNIRFMFGQCSRPVSAIYIEVLKHLSEHWRHWVILTRLPRKKYRLHQHEVLIDHADARPDGVAGGAEHAGLAIHQDFSRVRAVMPGQNGHKGALARAVLAEQGLDPPRMDIQADLPVGPHRPENLGDASQGHRRRSHGHGYPCRRPARGCTNCDSVSQGKRIHVSWLTSVT